MKDTILITGSSGCFGTAMIDLLIERYHTEFSEIRCFDMEPMPNDMIAKLEAKKNHNVKITFIYGNILDKQALDNLFSDRKINVVIHAASLIAPWQDPKKHMAVNVGGTENIMENCRKYGVKRVILISSMFVVINKNGIPTREGSEDLPYATDPLTAGYTNSKILQEKLVLGAYKPNEIFTCSLRPLGIFGPRDIYNIGSILGAAKSGVLVAWPDHEPAPWQHVFSGNLAYATYCVVKKSREQKDWVLLGGKSFNVGDNTEVGNFIDLMEPYLVGVGLSMPRWKLPLIFFWIYAILVEIMGFLCSILGIRMQLNFTRISLSTITTTHVYSWEKIRKFAGYEPLFNHQESTQITLEWFKDQGAVKDRFLDQ